MNDFAKKYCIGGALPYKFWIKADKKFSDHIGFNLPVKCDDQRDFERYKESEVIRIQNTGLEDKNGKEIYDGDIVSGYDMIGENDIQLCVVECSPWAGARVTKINGPRHSVLCDLYNMYDVPGHPLEVLGNIFENSNLLNHE